MPPRSVASLARTDVPVQEGFVRAADGTPLYYRAEGEGPAIVCCNGLGVSTFFWKYVVRAFAGPYRVVVWDYRSHGRSGRSSEPMGIGTCAADLQRVLDHLQIDRAVLLGHSLGTQVLFESYRRFGERIGGLVPTLGGYGRTVETFFGTRLSVPGLELMRRAAYLHRGLSETLLATVTKLPVTYHLARLTGLVHATLCSREDMEPYFEHLAQLDLDVYFELARDLQAHDASDVLPGIGVPVLVFGADRDLFTPLELSRKMTALIPEAELCVLRNGSHAALVEQPELYCLRLERFLTERLGLPGMARPPVPPAR